MLIYRQHKPCQQDRKRGTANNVATTFASIETPYTARYRVTGRADWSCPYCGHINVSRLVIGQAYVFCKAAACGRRFGIGHVFYVPEKAHAVSLRIMPPDYILPSQPQRDDPFPRVAVAVDPPPGAPFHIVAVDTGDSSDDTAK